MNEEETYRELDFRGHLSDKGKDHYIGILKRSILDAEQPKADRSEDKSNGVVKLCVTNNGSIPSAESSDTRKGCGKKLYGAWDDGDRTYDEYCDGDWLCKECQEDAKSVTNNMTENEKLEEDIAKEFSEEKF